MNRQGTSGALRSVFRACDGYAFAPPRQKCRSIPVEVRRSGKASQLRLHRWSIERFPPLCAKASCLDRVLSLPSAKLCRNRHLLCRNRHEKFPLPGSPFSCAKLTLQLARGSNGSRRAAKYPPLTTSFFG